ncbi:MAG: beta strand repeat-containing protein, partial [Nitrospinaceae bacterium]
ISGTKGGIFFQGASTFSTLTAESVNGMEVNANLTTTAGALTLDGDSNDVAENVAPNDSMTIANGVTLTSASDISLSATTSGISAAGALTLTAPSSITLTGNLTAAGAVDLTANSGITLNSNITTSSSSSLNIDANSSTLSLASGVVLSSAGALTLAASNASSLGNLTLTSTGSTVNINSALTSTGAVAMTANSGLNLNNIALTGAGNITLQGGTGLTLASGMGITSSAGSITLGASGGTIAANGALTLSSNGSITVSNTFTSAGAATLNANSGISIGTNFTANGAVAIDADLDNNGAGDFTISAGTLSTTNNALTVTANDLAMTGAIDSGTGSTTISFSDGDSLSIGLNGTGMSIDNATELGKIRGTGDINLLNGNIVVASGTTVSSSGNLTLGQSGGTITGQGALVLTGANGLTINSNTVSATGLLTLNATTGGISTPGTISLNATDGITINDAFASAGATTIDADSDNSSTGTFTLASALSTGNNTLSITAVDLALNSTLSSGTAGTTILSSQSTHTIGLGVASGNNMTLDNTDLGNITAGNLTIGDGTNGNITVDGVLSANSDQFGLLTLNATASGSSVIFGTTDSSLQGLTVNAGDGITLSSNLTTNGTTIFNSDSNSAGTGSFTINSLKTLNTTNNALTITSKSMSLNTNGAINSGTAETTLQVSQSADTIGLGGGAGTFSLSSNDLAQITAVGLTIGNATNGTITVDGVTSTSTPLTLVANSGASAVNFSSTASSFNNLTLDAGTGGVSFGSNLSAADLSVTSGGAITDTGALTITGTSSFTTDVANQAITLDNRSNAFTGAVNLNTSGTGDATLTSNSSVTLSTSTVGRDLNVTVGGDNSLSVTGAGSVGGLINLSADDDIIFTAVGDLITTTGNITVTADNDLDKNTSGGALTMVDGTVFNAGSGILALSADEDITLGRVETSSASNAAVTLTSSSGGVVDGDTALPPEFTSIGGDSSAWLDIDAANGRLVADVVTGFGADNPIETKVKSLDIDNSTSGETDIFEFDELDIFKINNAGGNTKVSFEGELTGQTNCAGACLFVRRDLRNILIGSKTLGQLANASNEQHKFDIFELNGQNFFDKIPVDHVPSSPNEPFTADLFSEKFELVELAAGTGGKFDGMEVSQAFWGGAKQPTLEVAEWNIPDKKTRSRQRLAKRKKRIGKKVDDTASITTTKPVRKAPKPRIQKSESGYLGFTP